VNIERSPRPYRQLAIYLSVLGLAAVGCCQEPAQPARGESEQTIQQQDQSQTTPIKLSNKDMKKLVVKRVSPVYPELARNARIVGKCGVRVVITPQGEIAEVRLDYGHPIIAPAAIDAVRKWKFRPYLLNGHPVEAEGEVEVNVP
jgi:TonB family protein